MGYAADGTLPELYREDFVDDSAERLARTAQEALYDRARALTPEAEIPEAYHGNRGAWIADRRGRRPGTLRDSWERHPVTRRGDVWRAVVENTDPIAPHVEWDTRPHAIVARRTRFLRFPLGPRFVYRRRVWHPGTEGQHMLRDASAWLETEQDAILERELEVIVAEENARR